MEQVFAVMEQVDLEFFWAATGEAYAISRTSPLDEDGLADAHGAYIGGGPL